jgi:cytochrome b6-f complex iron-sulfur subunit
MSDIKNQPETKKRVITRREFLSLAWIGILSLGTLKLAEIAGKVFLPRRPQGEYGGEFEIGFLTNLPKPTDAPLAYPEGRFWLVNTETGLLALHRACTHLDCLVSWDDGAQKFVCPCHGSEFSRAGTCLQGPASRALDRFPLRVVTPDGKVVVETDSAGAPLPVEQLISGADSSLATESVVMVDTASKMQGNPIG